MKHHGKMKPRRVQEIAAKLHTPSPSRSTSSAPSNVTVPALVKARTHPRNPSLKSLYVSEFRDKIKAAFVEARSLEKGDVQPLATWNRVVSECWDVEPNDVKARIDEMRVEKIEKLQKKCKDGPLTNEEQALCVQAALSFISYSLFLVGIYGLSPTSSWCL